MNLEPIWTMPTAGGAPVALTFDDGPDPDATPQVLDILADHGVTATFFVVGEVAARHPGVVRMLVDRGMGVGVHSWDHEHMAGRPRESSSEQIGRCVETLRALGADPQLFRPPYMEWDHAVIEAAMGAGLATVGGSVDAKDFECPGAGVIAARVRAGAAPGTIVGLHDGGGDRSQTVAALPEIIDGFGRAGLTVVDLLTQLTC
ncbi:MAG: oligosaccharide deacetylase [Acidimicrobiales bacterium]|nr:oligosaccharide deacetylase [Acidimicrobiales bacterium]